MIRKGLYQLCVVLGGLGLVGCIACLVVVWLVQTRMVRASNQAFQLAEDSVASVRLRLEETEARLGSLQLISAELRETVADRVASQAAMGRLESGLEQADKTLERTESALAVLQRTLEIGESMELSVETKSVDSLVEEVGWMRSELTQIGEWMDDLPERLTEEREDLSAENESSEDPQRFAGLQEKLKPLAVKLHTVGEQLGRLEAVLSEVASRTRSYIRLVALFTAGGIAWLAAGQFALVLLGRAKLRRRHA